MAWPYRLFGDRHHPPLVFLHGFLGDNRDWDFLVERFSVNYWCILPDLPGHGQNRLALPEKPITFRWLAAGLARTLAEMDIARAHLAGYSMGGRLGLYFAVYHPQQVASLILESTSPGLARRRERADRRRQDEQRAAEILSSGMDGFIDRWYQGPIFKSLGEHPEKLAALKLRRAQNNPATMSRLVTELSPGRQPSLWTKLTGIHMPVLLLAGGRDEKYVTLAEQMAALIPSAQLKIAPHAGHNLHLETPDWFGLVLADFLAGYKI